VLEFLKDYEIFDPKKGEAGDWGGQFKGKG
jgi:hypothetical protein